MIGFTGVLVLHVEEELVNNLYREKRLSASFLMPIVAGTNIELVPHLYLVLKANPFDHAHKKSALAKVDYTGSTIRLLKDYKKYPIQGIAPRNKEQNMLFDALLDNEAQCVIVEGRAGSGKTICALAAALEHAFDKNSFYEKIILTRPMSSVGASLGSLPGDQSEKFLPYLGNYFTNIEKILGKNGVKYFETMVSKGKIEFWPLQLVGGASWHNALILADEAQSLTPQQTYALGTRPAEGSKLILMGDLVQRYGKVKAIEDTGFYKLINSQYVQDSSRFAYLKLLKQERSEIAEVFYKTFLEC